MFKNLLTISALTFQSEGVDITFAEVNCKDRTSLDLCSQEDIDSFPKLHMYTREDLEDIFTGDSG